MGEFELIRRYFAEQSPRAEVSLGIGDDCALLAPRVGQQLAVSIDTLIEGVHFPVATAAEDVGHKALAVNLSDLAAMGAEPAWCTLALSLPQVDHAWLEGFCRGFFALAKTHGVSLVGGDTTCGPLSITVQIAGWVPSGQALLRSRAQVGDRIFVSGALGGGALGLWALQNAQTERYPGALAKLNRPEPRIAHGRALGLCANACIDISDGLWQDLGHILCASGVGAELHRTALPLWPGLDKHPEGLQWALAGGDDFELCCTIAPERPLPAGLALHEIGVITEATGLRLLDERGQTMRDFNPQAYDHFRVST